MRKGGLRPPLIAFKSSNDKNRIDFNAYRWIAKRRIRIINSLYQTAYTADAKFLLKNKKIC
jgi:hypothetical protein